MLFKSSISCLILINYKSLLKEPESILVKTRRFRFHEQTLFSFLMLSWVHEIIRKMSSFKSVGHAQNTCKNANKPSTLALNSASVTRGRSTAAPSAGPSVTTCQLCTSSPDSGTLCCRPSTRIHETERHAAQKSRMTVEGLFYSEYYRRSAQ